MFGWLKRLFEGGSQGDSEHAMIVTLEGPIELSAIHDLEDALRTVIDEAGVGEVDGHEVAVDRSDAKIYVYGADARQLFESAASTLESTDLASRTRVLLRFGSVDDMEAPETSFVLGDDPIWP